MKKLTAIAVANLKPKAKRYEVSDTTPGLRVCVFPSGRKSFLCRYRFKGAQKKLTLGEVGALTLEDARVLAANAVRDARKGIDATAEKQKARQQEAVAASETLAAVAAEYLKRVGPGLRSIDQRKSDLDEITKKLGELPIAEIKRSRFISVLDDVADTRGPVRADRVLSALKTLLRWHSGRDDDYVSVLTPTRRRVSIKERARERVLTDDELQRIWLAAEADQPFGAFVRFVLLTATRRNEARGMRRSEISPDGLIWTVPASRVKGKKDHKKDHVVPLSEAARAIIASMPDRDLVFSGNGVHQMGNLGARKEALDVASGTSGWTLHDLRRTARSLMSRAGVRPDVGERCLGHSIGGVREVYDRHRYETEKGAAFEALAGLIELIVRPPSGNVVPLKA